MYQEPHFGWHGIELWINGEQMFHGLNGFYL